MPTWIQTMLDWASSILGPLAGTLEDIIETVLESIQVFSDCLPTMFIGVLELVIIIKFIKGAREL